MATTGEPDLLLARRQLAANLASIRLLQLHERLEAHYQILHRLEGRCEGAFRAGDLTALEALQTKRQKTKARLETLQHDLAFAASEYRIRQQSLDEARFPRN